MRHPVDHHVGGNLRRLRKLKGMSQAELGLRLGVTFQQVHKYEVGSIRVSASKLWLASRALEVSVGDFYSGLCSPDESRTARDALPQLLGALPERHRQLVTALARSLLSSGEADA